MNKNHLILVALCLSVSITARSEDAPLSLSNAVELAATQSAEVRASQAQIDAADAAVVPAGQLPDPELVVGIEELPVTGDLAYSLTRDDFTMRKVGVMQSFPRRFKRELRTQRATDEAQLTRAQAEQAELEVMRQAAQSWIGAYFAQETARRLLGLVPVLELQTRIATAGVASGRLTTTDAFAAQVALVEFRDRVRVAKQSARRARLDLARWLPADAERPLGTPPSFESLPIAAAQLQTNVHHHASLIAYDRRIDAARTDVALAQADKHPDWSVELDYSNRGKPFSDMVTLEFRVGLPLFAGKRQDPLIAAKRAQLRKIESDRETELRMHSAEVSQQLTDWESLKERVKTYETELVPLAHTRAQAALSAFQSAQSTIKPVLDARAAEIDAQVQALDLRGQLGRAWAFLSYLQYPRSSP